MSAANATLTPAALSAIDSLIAHVGGQYADAPAELDAADPIAPSDRLWWSAETRDNPGPEADGEAEREEWSAGFADLDAEAYHALGRHENGYCP